MLQGKGGGVTVEREGERPEGGGRGGGNEQGSEVKRHNTIPNAHYTVLQLFTAANSHRSRDTMRMI